MDSKKYIQHKLIFHLFLTSDCCSSQKLYILLDDSHVTMIKCNNNIQRITPLYCNKCNISPSKLDGLLGIEVICNYVLV